MIFVRRRPAIADIQLMLQTCGGMGGGDMLRRAVSLKTSLFPMATFQNDIGTEDLPRTMGMRNERGDRVTIFRLSLCWYKGHHSGAMISTIPQLPHGGACAALKIRC